MATIDSLVEAAIVGDNDLLLIDQGGEGKKLKKGNLKVDAENVLDANGGSVQDFIDAQYTTVAELATGKFGAGQYVRLTDRAMGLFLLQSGGVVNGGNILYAGNENTAVLQIKNGRPSFAEFGVVDDPTGIHQVNNTYRIQQALDAKGKVQGIQNATYFLTKEITVPEGTIYYAKQANHKQHSTFTYTGTSYSTVIVLGDASSQTGLNLSRCCVIGAVVDEEFLGDPNILADIENVLNYTSIADYGIRAQRTDDSYAKNCTVNGMKTSGIGAEWSNNFLYERNKITTCRFHGIANQGGTAVARSHKVKDNIVIGCGGMAFNINTAAGGTVELSGNICRNVKQFYKCTEGSAYSSNNECYSWSERDDTFSAYGNSAGLNATNDKLFNFARLTASGTQGANYQWDGITYISNNGSLLTVVDNTAYRLSDSVISIVTDKDQPIIGFATGAAKTGFEVSITTCSMSFDTTAAANASSQGVISLAGWSNANINISNNNKFECTGLSSQRIIIGCNSVIGSASGLAIFDSNNIESTGYDQQLGLFLKNSHNTRFTNNNLRGVSVGSYETTEDFAVNFVQHTNISNVQFTLSIGAQNRIYDYLAVGRSGTVAPSGNKTPNFIGERYFRWTVGDFYQAYGTSTTQWKLLG